MKSPKLTIRTLMTLTLLTAACGSSEVRDTTDERGVLVLDISGLPVGAAGDVTLTHPGGATQVVPATAAFGDLAVGEYIVVADPVAVGPALYDPAIGAQLVRVFAGDVTDVRVPYEHAGVFDAAGDAFGDDIGTNVNYDIRTIRANRGNSYVLEIELVQNITIPAPGEVMADGHFIGYLSFDTDRDVATGNPPIANMVCDPVDIGVERTIALTERDAADGSYLIIDDTGARTGFAFPEVYENVLRLRIEDTLLPTTERSQVAGLFGSYGQATECIPDGTPGEI